MSIIKNEVEIISATLRTIRAPWLTFQLVKLFGKRRVIESYEGQVTLANWCGADYFISANDDHNRE